MTPDSPQPSDGKPNPQRLRPNLKNLAKDTTEQDLWDFGDEVEDGDEVEEPIEPTPKKPRVELPSKSGNGMASKKKETIHRSSDIVRQKTRRSGLGLNELKASSSDIETPDESDQESVIDEIADPPVEEIPDNSPTETEHDSIEVTGDENEVEPSDLRKEDDTEIPEQISDEAPISEHEADGEEKPASDDDKNTYILGDIDEWEELGGELVELPKEPEEKSAVEEKPAEISSRKIDLTPSEEPSKINKKKSPLLKFRLSGMEAICIGIFALLLIAGAVFFFANSINKIPEPPKQLTEKDFPISGKHFTAATVETFWREPVLTGDKADAVRRGTNLIPVLKITTKGGSGAVRVTFYDQDGKSVGDVISRSVADGKTIEVAATSGFDDINMHSAYRTGDMKPWTVEVHEGPSENAMGSEFSKLFKIAISPALH